ncbi:hypothetical protein [Anabaena sp. AL93]|jgi:hypothetical protein|uniref:hypothetical protein n=1 Tax=Anabaena sp. AL93 TaxID=1678133 RepID=UPI0025B9EED9|nr:hypothetical protein [Anabaena sp. AL93]MCX5980878.1 hypothetical protein [Nostocales cyanobacterium LacPavin_0920_SED1_MAG_38_18]
MLYIFILWKVHAMNDLSDMTVLACIDCNDLLSSQSNQQIFPTVLKFLESDRFKVRSLSDKDK